MSYVNTDFFMLFLTVSVFTVVQSVFGVGLLVFGTPTLLLLGYSFYETLTYLLPSSIVVSFFQVYYRWNYISLYKGNVFYFLLPMVAFGLLIIVYISAVDLYLMIGIMLLFTSIARFSPSLSDLLGKLLSNNFRISLAFIGFIHGLTNLGGAPLVAITNGIYNHKKEIQSNIAYAYLTMAVVQIIILVAISEFAFDNIVLILPFFSAIIYLSLGEHIFESTSQNIYENLMTFFIFVYGLLLISNSF